MVHFPRDYWPQTASRVEFFPASSQPNLPVTAVKIYVFRADALLLAHIKGRGWDLPGGHIEADESPEEAITRELREETGVSVDRKALIGYLRITNEQETDDNRKYPSVSCILIYKGWGAVFDTDSHLSLESTAAKFVARRQLPDIHHDWNAHKAGVIDYAAAWERRV